MSIRKFTAVLVMASLLCLNLNTAIPAQVEKKPILAVLPLHAVDIMDIEARQVTLFIIDHMRRTELFIVPDIPHIENALRDAGLDAASRIGVLDAVRAGKSISADKVITGTLSRDGDAYVADLETIDVAGLRVESSSRIRSKLGFEELPAAMAALLEPIVHPKSAVPPADSIKVEEEPVVVAAKENTLPETKKPAPPKPVEPEPEAKKDEKAAEEVVVEVEAEEVAETEAEKEDVKAEEEKLAEEKKPGEAKPVIAAKPAVAPKAKKGGFPWLIGALAAGGVIAIAVFAGGGSGGSGSSGPTPAQTGSIQVNSNPTGAKIFHNGSDTGRTTNSILTNVSPGTHTIKLVREGYVDVEGQVSVTAGQTATFSWTLTRHTISVTAPVAGAVWVPGQEVEIRWTTGGGAAVHVAVPANSTLAGREILDGGLAAQRTAVREQALMGKAGVRHGSLFGGLSDDRVDAGKPAALRERAGGRTDSSTGRVHQNMRPGGATQPGQDASARSAGASTPDRAGGRFVPPLAAAEFAGAMISGKPAVQDDSLVLVLSSVGIKLYRGAIEVRTIIAKTNNTGAYKWTIPSDQTEGTNYKVRVFCADAAEVYGESPGFKIESRRTETIRGIEMVYIPAGEFMMGSNEGAPAERPVHQIRITKGFWMGKYEVTQGQWRDIMGSNPSYFQKGDSYPVEQVSWNDVQSFIQRLNQLTGRTFRLPTEAEWEYACRAGTTGERYGNLNDIAWYDGNSGGSTQPVGRKQPNGFGLYDMLGNVWEWVQDWYDSTYYSRSPTNDPPGPSSGSFRVSRGGSWLSLWNVRAALRYYGSPSSRILYLGFRLVRTD